MYLSPLARPGKLSTTKHIFFRVLNFKLPEGLTLQDDKSFFFQKWD